MFKTGDVVYLQSWAMVDVEESMDSLLARVVDNGYEDGDFVYELEIKRVLALKTPDTPSVIFEEVVEKPKKTRKPRAKKGAKKGKKA